MSSVAIAGSVKIEMMLVYTIILTAIGLSWAQLSEPEVKEKLN